MPDDILERNSNGLEYLSRKSVKKMRDRFRVNIDQQLKEVVDENTPESKVKALRKYLIVKKLIRAPFSLEKLEENAFKDEERLSSLIKLFAKPLFYPEQITRIKEAANKKYKKHGHGLLGTNNRRLYFPLEGDSETSLVEEKIGAYLNDKGYFITDYKQGYATDIEGKQQYKIGKLLQEDLDLRKEFMHDAVRLKPIKNDKNTPNQQYLVLSDYVNDIAYMSTRRGWTSCTAYNDTYQDMPPHDIEEGTLVGYLVNDDDPHIFNPTARVLFKPFRNKNGDTIYHANKIYSIDGTNTNLFEKTAHIIAEKISSDNAGIYDRAKNIYADGAPKSKIRLDEKKVNTMNAEEFLDALDIKYRKDINDKIIIDGNLDISKLELKRLPDLTEVTVNGHFFCNHNKLTSLIGAPTDVDGFYCDHNNLTNLEGAPEKVGNFHCYNNNLVTLEGGPKEARNFYCHDNKLTNLDGAPKGVCSFHCYNNNLTNLIGVPKSVEELESDFGDFTSYTEIPNNLLTTKQTTSKKAFDF